MIKRLLALCLLQPFSVNALDNQIHISREQISDLGIVLGALSASSQIPLLSAPAKVVVPANHERLINSTQPGLIVQLQANIGDYIQKGQELAIINSPELVNLQRDYLMADSELNLAELDYNRDKKLLDEGVIADRRWHETDSLHTGKTAHSNSARQLLEMAGMADAEIKHLTHTGKLSSVLHVRAPISGVVLERYATVGSRLDILAPIYRIADLSELWLEINIPQERVHTVHIGDLVRIENTTITAKISLLGQSVNKDNQTVLARAVINGKTDTLRAGQNINVEIMTNSAKGNFRINDAAIAQNAGHNFIFVRNSDGFYVTEVSVNGKQGGESLISGAIADNAQIAVKGAVALKAVWLGLGEGE